MKQSFQSYLASFVVESFLPETDLFLLEGYEQVLFNDNIKHRIVHDYIRRKMNGDVKQRGVLHGSILNHGDKRYEFYEMKTSLPHSIIKVVQKSNRKTVLHV